MEQMWKICELEESRSVKLTRYERFSVTPVPESWIVYLDDGTCVCFWPCFNAESKIRSLHFPEKGEKSKYYKCRVLLDGAKFSSYEKADEAVRIAQNVTSIEDDSVSMEIQETGNALESSMHFDVVSCTSEDEDNDDTVDHESSGFRVIEGDTEAESSAFDVETDDEGGELVGNDTFEYNKEVLKGGRYVSRKAITFEVEDLGAPTDTNSVAMSEIPVNLDDYHSKFGANDGNFSTSTILGADDAEKRKLSGIMEKMASIEAKVFSFWKSIESEWNDVKYTVTQMQLRETKDVQQEQELRFSDEIVQPVIIELSEYGNETPIVDSIHNSPLYVVSSVISPDHQTGNIEAHLSQDVNKFQENASTTGGVSIGEQQDVRMAPSHSRIIVDLTKNGFNETFLVEPLNAIDDLNGQSPEILLNNVPVDIPAHNEPPSPDKVAHSSEDPNTDKLRYPSYNVPDYIHNEDLLGEHRFDSVLIKFLQPYGDETEAVYVERTTGKLFTDDFFLDCVSWKKEKDRVNIKTSKLLSCWKKSFGKMFPAIVDDKKLQAHFRRVKSKKRAQIKTKMDVEVVKKKKKEN